MRTRLSGAAGWVKKRPILFSSLVLGAAIIVGNAYTLFEKDSKIERIYYIDQYKQVYAKNNDARIDKKAIVTPLETYTISADAEALASISVKRGQEVMANEELAVYRSDALAEQQSLLQDELAAYESELSQLEDVLSQLESEDNQNEKPSSYINSSQVGNKLDVSIELALQKQTSAAGAVAVVNGYIAETERQIEILNSRLDQMEINRAETSPIDGVIADIIQENGTVTFTIYAKEKSLRAYVVEDEWKKVEENQSAELDVKGQKEKIDATVAIKQAIMASGDSIWEQEFAKSTKLPVSTYYELEIVPTNTLTELPYASMADASIIVDEAANSYRVKTAWLKKVKVKKAKEATETEANVEAEQSSSDLEATVDDETEMDMETTVDNESEMDIESTTVEDTTLEDNEINQTESNTEETNSDAITGQAKETKKTYLYSIGYDGRVRFEPVKVAFKDGHESIIVSAVDEGTPILDDTKRTPLYRTFVTMPLENPDWKLLKELSWKEYIRYLLF